MAIEADAAQEERGGHFGSRHFGGVDFDRARAAGLVGEPFDCREFELVVGMIGNGRPLQQEDPASILRDCVVEYGADNPRLPDKFFSAQARFQRTPWLFAAGDDLRFLATLGTRTSSVRLFNWYRLMVAACSNDRWVGTRLSEVTQFVRPLSSLFAPQMVWRLVVERMGRRVSRVNRHVPYETPLMPPGV